MSNQRRAGNRTSYTAGYLHSPAWFARRDRWFRTRARQRTPLVCAACGQIATPRTLELHHLDYRGIRRLADGQWQAAERHADLVPLHPGCHELLHRLIDRDVVLARHRTRRDASRIALDRLRARLRPAEEAS